MNQWMSSTDGAPDEPQLDSSLDWSSFVDMLDPRMRIACWMIWTCCSARWPASAAPGRKDGYLGKARRTERSVTAEENPARGATVPGGDFARHHLRRKVLIGAIAAAATGSYSECAAQGRVDGT
jgi:hypothetical protein